MAKLHKKKRFSDGTIKGEQNKPSMASSLRS